MDKETIAASIRDGLCIHREVEPKKRSGRFWATFDRIFIVKDDNSEELVQNFIICRVCKSVKKYNTGQGVTNLNGHSDQCKQPKQTLKSFITRDNIIRHEQKKELCYQIVRTAVKDIRPFSLTEGEGMLNLLHCVWNMGAKVGIVSREEIQRSLPCPTTFSRNVNRLGDVSKSELKMKLQAEIGSGTSLAMTTDIWQDKYKRYSYFAITVHYFDQTKSELVDYIITMHPMEVSRKKDNVYLREIIDARMSEYGLMQKKDDLVFVSDRGGNIRVALKEYKRLNCFPHFCHSIVKYACEVDAIKELNKNCAALVKYFKFNGLNNILEQTLKSAISTRFNYLFMMLTSIDNEWEPITTILTQRNELHRMNDIDRVLVKQMILFLSPFNTASKFTESNYKATLAYVWIGITQICSTCRIHQNDPHTIKALKARSLEYVESKFILHQYHRIATFLHPNFKTLIFCSFEQKMKTIRDTKNILNEMISTPQPSTSSTPSNSAGRRSSSNSTASSSSSTSSFLSDYFGECDEPINEVDYYINIQWTPAENVDVFNWWIERRNMFPNLFKLALKMHSIPASSLQSERTFSRSGLTVNDRRCNLNPKTVENLMLLNKNFDFEVRLNNFCAIS